MAEECTSDWILGQHPEVRDEDGRLFSLRKGDEKASRCGPRIRLELVDRARTCCSVITIPKPLSQEMQYAQCIGIDKGRWRCVPSFFGM